MATFYKITNAEENHFGFQYRDGLNILIDKFDDDPTHHCCKGGFYFTDIEYIFAYMSYGIYVREVMLPMENPDFRIVDDAYKYRANMLVFGKRYNLDDVETYKMLIDRGADIGAGGNAALKTNAAAGRMDIVKYLVEKGANIRADNDQALKYAAIGGHLEIMRYLIKCGANVNVLDKTLINKLVLSMSR